MNHVIMAKNLIKNDYIKEPLIHYKKSLIKSENKKIPLNIDVIPRISLRKT